jgi:hypothetical protein
VDPITVTIREMGKDRDAEVDIDPLTSFSDLLANVREHWSLPEGKDYVIRHVDNSTQVDLAQSLKQAGVRSGHTLEIQYMPDAG